MDPSKFGDERPRFVRAVQSPIGLAQEGLGI